MTADSGVARVELVRGPVPGVARFYRLRSGRFSRSAKYIFCTIIHWAPRKRSHGSLGYLQHTLVLLERRRGIAILVDIAKRATADSAKRVSNAK